KRTDTLNQGREKLNTAITDAETAKIVSEQADDKATQALAKSESTQTQLDTIVIDGDSSVEAAQARVSTTGTAYGTLKQRLDTEYQEVTTQLAQTKNKLTFRHLSEWGSISDGATDETTLVQTALDEMETQSVLIIPIKTKWDYNLITHPLDINIVDQSTYDWDRDDWSAQFRTIVNASSPETKDANEDIFMSPYHPAKIVDVR